MKDRNITLSVAGLFMTAALLGGCSSGQPQEKTLYAQEFAPEEQQCDLQRVNANQMAAGARADMTLYPGHFDGAGLSSLGTQKLDRALRDSHSMDPLVVYIAIDHDQFAAEHRLTITNYLADRGGLKPEQIEFKNGPQPDTYAPASDGLDGIKKQEDNGGAPPSSGGGASGGTTH